MLTDIDVPAPVGGMLRSGMIPVMSNESKFEGIRLAYVHLSVTTPRGSGPRGAPAEITLATRGAGHGQWGRVVQPRPADRPTGLAA